MTNEKENGFFFNQQEMKTNGKILHDALLTAIQKKESGSNFISNAIKSSQMLIQLFKKNDIFNSLLPLMQSILHYFETVQTGMPIEQELLESLKAFAEKLLNIVDQQKIQMQKSLESLPDEEKYLKDQLIQAVHKFEMGHFEEKKSEQEKRTDFSKVDRAIVDLFLHELSLQVQTIKACIETLHNDSRSISSLETLIRNVREITQAAKIVQIDFAFRLGKTLEDFLIKRKEKKIFWEINDEKIVTQILVFFEEFSQISSNQIASFFEDKKELVNDLIHQMAIKGEVKEEKNLPQEKRKEEKPLIFQESLFDSTMFDLFNAELETQCKVLSQGLIEIERKPQDQKLLESLMRAAHSIKGAARVVSLDPIVRLAHAMEDCFVAAQSQKRPLLVNQVNQLLLAVDILARLAKVQVKKINPWLSEQLPLVETLILDIPSASSQVHLVEPIKNGQLEEKEPEKLPLSLSMKMMGKEGKIIESKKAFQTSLAQDRVIRITAQNLNRLMGLAGESLVESRWLSPFGESLQNLKNNLKDLTSTIDLLRENLPKRKTQSNCTT